MHDSVTGTVIESVTVPETPFVSAGVTQRAFKINNQEHAMDWDGVERRTGGDRRHGERAGASRAGAPVSF